MPILSFIPAWIWALVLVFGVLGLFFRNSISNAMGMIGRPLGLKITTTLVILSLLAIFAGGFGVVTGYYTQFTSGGTIASITGAEQPAVTQPSMLTCQFVSAPTAYNYTAGCASATTFRSDPTKLNNYYVDVPFMCGTDYLNGTLLCMDNRADVSKGVSHTCYAKADAYRSQTSTTDANTYFIVATGTTASQVSGLTWAQNIYLADSSGTATVATIASAKEKTPIMFAQDEVQNYLGFAMNLTGSTNFGYLNNQSTNQVHFICDGQEVSTLTITKLAKN
jgi:hypothetical protein